MKFIRCFLAACAALAITTTASAQEFRLLSSWDSNYAYNPYLLDPFVDGVKKATDGRITFQISGPETVAPFEQLEPVSSGVFHLLFTHGSYHSGTTPAMMAVEALQGDLASLRESGLFDFLDQHYQKQNLKLVMLPVSPHGAYNLILREPVNDNGDIAGRKIRGIQTYSGIVEMLNGVVTVLPVSDVYTGLEKGLIDGTAWPIIGALDYRWNEVADYLLRPGFGVNYEPMFMNLDAWNRLSPEDQKVFQDVARDIEDAWTKDALAVWQAEEAELVAKGMKVTEMGKAQQDKLDDAWANGLLKEARKLDSKFTDELEKFAKSKGLLE